MEKYFEGLDPLPLHENGFELRRDGEIFLSLYHDLALKGFDYRNGDFTMYFAGRPDAAHSDSASDKRWSLRLQEAELYLIESRGEGNFEDVHELTLRSEKAEKIELLIVIGAMTLVFVASKVVLREDPEGDVWYYGK